MYNHHLLRLILCMFRPGHTEYQIAAKKLCELFPCESGVIIVITYYRTEKNNSLFHKIHSIVDMIIILLLYNNIIF